MNERRALAVAAALAVFASTAAAQERAHVAAAGVLPADEILASLSTSGFTPTGRPVQSGGRYELEAIDPYDLDVRLLVDARTGKIVAVRHHAGPEAVHAAMSGRAYAQYQYGPYRRSVSPWAARRWREGRPVPPRAIPSGRTAARSAPLPRPRPDEQSGAAGASATKPLAAPAPDTAKSSPSAATPAPDAARSASSAANAAPNAVAPAPNAGPPASNAAASAPSGGINIVPVAPLE